MPITIRAGRAADLDAVAAVYGHAVRTGVATFDTADPPVAYWSEKLASRERGDHLLVAEEVPQAAGAAGTDGASKAQGAGAVVGFAYSGSFRPRPAYASTRETSIYLAPTAVGRGLGRAMYGRLLDLVRADGMHCAVAVVAQPNPASVALHESLGFEMVGTLREVGRKFDRWVDTRWYQLLLEQ